MRVDVSASAKTRQEQAVLRDLDVRRIVEATPEEITAWIEENVTNLATAKTVLKTFAKLLVILARRAGASL